MKDWNDKEVQVAHSKGGVLALASPMDNLISTGINPWPPPEILQKLYQSRQSRAFDGKQLEIAQSALGYYCDLQSIHSEDAITWSVFGTVARSGSKVREEWVGEFFSLIGIPRNSAKHADIFLWRRVPHPDTIGLGGPEIDFGIITPDTVILGEAKWRSGVGKSQGKAKDKDQVQLRMEFLAKYGTRIYPNANKLVVLGIGLYPNFSSNSISSSVVFQSLLWEHVCAIGSHPLADEVKRYFEWKKRHTVDL